MFLLTSDTKGPVSDKILLVVTCKISNKLARACDDVRRLVLCNTNTDSQERWQCVHNTAGWQKSIIAWLEGG